MSARRGRGGFRPGEDIALEATPPPPPGLSFTEAADAQGSDADVLMGYRVFLGRDPENAFVIAEARTSPVGAFIRGLMESDEFRASVLDRLAGGGGALPHEDSAAGPGARELDWLFSLVGVPAEAEAWLRQVPRWTDWFRALVAIPGFPAQLRPPPPAPAEPPPAPAAAEIPRKKRAVADGLILITIEQPAANDVIHPGQTINGRGWAIAPADVAEVRVQLDDTLLAFANYGLERPDVAASFPQYRHADHCGFSFSAALPAGMAPGEAVLTVSLRTLAGQTESKGIRLRLAEEQQAAAEVPPAVAARPIRLMVEEAIVDSSRRLWMRGWAVSTAKLGRLGVWLGAEELGVACHGARRSDLTELQATYPNAAHAGWSLTRALGPALPPGPAVLRVQAQDEAGHSRQAIVSVTLPPAAAAPAGLIEGGFDGATIAADGRLRVAGWVRAPGGVPVIRLELDGAWLGDATPGEPRDDVDAPRRADAEAFDFGFTQLLGDAKAGGLRLRCHVAGRQGGSLLLETEVAAESPERALRAARAAQLAAASALADAAGLRLEVDFPAHADGRAREALRGALTISGWTIAYQGVSGVRVFCDGAPLGDAYLGMRREDIGSAFPDHQGALLAGFALVMPPGTLPAGVRRIRVVAEAQHSGAPVTREVAFDLEVLRFDALPPGGTIRLALPPAEVAFCRQRLPQAASRPSFLVVLAGQGTAPVDPGALAATLASLRGQVFEAWHAVVALPDAAAVRSARPLAAADPSGRILLGTRRKAAAAAAAADAANRFTLCLRPGDRLGADALLELAAWIAADPAAEFIYADEVRLDPAQGRRQPFFKPDWSPELLLGMNYVGRPWCAAAALLDRAGLSAAALADLPDYDAVLRLTEHAAGIGHVARVLCDRGETGDSAAQEEAALWAALARRGMAAELGPGPAAGTWRVKRRGDAAPCRVSIIMPTCGARELVRAAIKTIRATTSPAKSGGTAVEIVILDNTPRSDTRLRAWLRRQADVVIDMPGPFNWSRFNNEGAKAATGDVLLFLNDDIEATAPGWLEAMLEHVRRRGVGVVGARLTYPNGTVQHGGQYLSGAHARHAFRFADAASPGPFGLAQVAREVISVTGACQMVRAAVFAQLGGFDEAHDVVNNDLDFCLRCGAAGLSVVFTPHATLVHHELASRAAMEDSFDAERFAGAWRTRFLAGDPFRNPHLRPEGDHYGWEREPAMLLHAGRRGPQPSEVRRILAVKLDHIGDFLTALPALRSLRRRFPAARIDLLCPAATAELARQEPAIDDIILFDFFHARSGEGRRGVSEAELAELAARLAPAAYDIAIDLRMHPDTREVLPHAGAAFLVGYDHDDRFAFLDVALAWEGDAHLVGKRANVSERLVQLVAALEAACGQEAAPPDPPRLRPQAVSALANLPAEFLARRLVCVHPGVGNPVRQWPVAHFAGLIDLLAAAGYHCILIGAPSEAAVAAEVIAGVAATGAVRSLVGQVKLAELGGVMRACEMFVGNNSGPQHLAASLGLPTLGIHSGVVDATEWAPLGTRAMAIRRRMVCSPCYLEFASDCPRNLACLEGLRPQDAFAACRVLMGAIRDEVV